MAGVPLAGVLLDGVPLAGVLLDGVPLGGVLLDGVPLAGVLLDGVPLDGVPLAGVRLFNLAFKTLSGVAKERGTPKRKPIKTPKIKDARDTKSPMHADENPPPEK
jgi:hypothetical protein